MKKTRWFSAMKHKPVRAGVYEFYDALWGQTVMAHWGGEYWTCDGSWRWNTYVGDKWRGLLTPNAELTGRRRVDGLAVRPMMNQGGRTAKLASRWRSG